MLVYTPAKDMDMILAGIWARIAQEGELDQLLYEGGQPLSRFMKDAQPPNTCFLEVDPKTGPWFFFLLSPFYSGAWVACWMAPEKRSSKEGLQAIKDAHEAALSLYPVLLALTTQLTLAEEMEKLGWRNVGKIYALAGEDSLTNRLLSLNKGEFLL